MSRKDKDKKKEHPAHEPVAETENTAASGAAETEEQNAPETGSDPDANGVHLTQEEFEQTKKLLESLSSEKEETVRLLQRTQADFDNYRRRNAAAKAESY